MIKALLSGIIKLIIGLVSILFYPIDLAISAILPDVSTMFTYVAQFFTIIGNGISYALSFIPIFPEFWVVFVAIYTIRLTFPITMYAIKLALRWYDKVKP